MGELDIGRWVRRREKKEGYLELERGRHLKNDMETQFSENFLEYLKVILMRTSSNGEYKASTGHLLQPGEASSGGTGLHSIELLANGNSRTAQPVLKTKFCSLQTEHMNTSLRTTHTEITEHGEVKLMPTWNTLLCSCHLGIGGETWTPIQLQNL